jgi:hypothetical protein
MRIQQNDTGARGDGRKSAVSRLVMAVRQLLLACDMEHFRCGLSPTKKKKCHRQNLTCTPTVEWTCDCFLLFMQLYFAEKLCH